jgi:hypothetical protein
MRNLQWKLQLFEFTTMDHNASQFDMALSLLKRSINDSLVPTHVKRTTAQVVTNLQQTCGSTVPTTCQQDVFALLVPSLLTSCLYGLLTTCYKVVELNRLVACCSNNSLSSCNSTSYVWQPCNNLMKQHHCYSLLTSLLQACCEHIFCWQVVRFLRVCVASLGPFQ